MESYINNYWGKNKSIQREAAEKVIPGSAQDLRALGASRAFTKQGPAGSEMGRRALVGAGAGTALLTHGLTTGNLGSVALAGVGAAATSPQVHKQVIGRASIMIEKMGMGKMLGAVQKNPTLLNAISNPKLRALMKSAMEEQAGVLPKAAGTERSTDREPSAGPGPQNNRYINDDESKKHFLDGN
jgi:hypothetical protein